MTREDISELHVADFVLGMLFVQPYVTFEDVYRGYGSEVHATSLLCIVYGGAVMVQI